MLAANNERQFAALCGVLGHPEWPQDPRWKDPGIRAANQASLREVFEKAFLSKPATQWEALLDEAGVPASRVRKLSETLAEGQPQARGMLKTLPVGAEQTQVSLPGIGFRMNGQPLLPDSPPRGPGADTPRWQD